jgi:D-threo-aldose 1-dehydrogenase
MPRDAKSKPTQWLNRTARLGSTGVRVPALGFGGSSLGNLYREIDDDAAAATILRACEQGFTYFDTAPFYGFGLSESRLGASLASRDDSIVLSTKVGRVLEPLPAGKSGGSRYGFVNAAPFEPSFDYSYDGVMRSFEGSCRRLRRERLDIVFAHDLGAATHGGEHARRFKEFIEGGYVAMKALKEAGAVGAIGLGVNEWEICEQALAVADFDCMLLAGRYTLLDQSALASMLPLCGRRGVSVIIGGPYNSGILMHGSRATSGALYDYAPASEAVRQRVARMEEICAAHDVALPAAALQFPLAHPVVASVIPGIATVEQVDDTLHLATARIPPAFWSDMKVAGLLSELAPTPEPKSRNNA